MRRYKTPLLLALAALLLYLSVSVYRLENRRREMKEDLIELSKVKYGLFSVDEWKKILATIISKKVEELDFSGNDREEMRKKVSALLYKVIDDFEARYHEKNSRSLRGILQSAVTSAFGAFDKVRADVPKFTDQILNFLNDPKNRLAIRKYIIDKLNQYADNTFAKLDYSTHNSILSKYHFDDRKNAIEGLTKDIAALDSASRPYKIIILSVTLIVIVWVLMSKAFSRTEYTLLILISLLMLTTGLLLPMIEIDARISSMSFTLLGEPIRFEDQVLYYKSKSILEVVSLMFNQSRADVLIVGILVLLFSVLFPLMKLIASALFIYRKQLRGNPVIRFFVFKTGKWSMADVMVIAIFMSYIGFSGIITEQLRQIESIASSIDILTTNRSSLLTGFFFFTAFAIFGISISQKLEAQYPQKNN